MSDPDRTLEAIDGVLAYWSGSDDAMVWTADGTKEPDASRCDCGPEDACYICVPCDICRDGEEECGCGGDDGFDCYSCSNSGWHVPDHCCGCGGSPYCAACHTCGAPCFGDCRCPVTVRLESGATLTL